MAALGFTCLLLALAVCVYGIGASLYGVRRGRVEFSDAGRRAVYALAGILTVAFIVLEVAFDGIQRSTRHASGFALRFPRIARIRDDKTPHEADTVETVEKLYAAQIESGHREESVAKKPKRGGRRSGYKPDLRQKSKQLKLFDD